MSKRSLGSSSARKDVVSKAMRVSGATDKACFELLRLGQESGPGTVPSSLTTFRQEVTDQLLEHAINRIPLNVDSKGEALFVPVTDIRAYFKKLVSTNADFHQRLKKLMEKSQQEPLSMILYLDEAQAGNILSPNLNKKVMFAYVAIAELGMLHCETSWFDLAAFSHGAIGEVLGGWSRIFKEIILFLDNLHMERGFSVGHKDLDPFWLRLQITSITGDFDAIRCLYDWKGARAIKPCLLCKNVVSRSSGLTAFNAQLVDLTEEDMSRCFQWTDHEVNHMWDKPRFNAAATRKEQDLDEKSAGFNIYNRNALLAHPIARQSLPMSKLYFDAMHLYFSNGLANWEVCMFMTAARSHGITPEILGTAFKASDWKTSSTKGSKKWYENLMSPQLFTTDSYKGCASDLKALLVLLHFHISQIPGLNNHLQAELKSFESLLEVTQCLYQLQMRSEPSHEVLAKLKQAQLLHHRHFCSAYGQDSMKPKHHLSKHLGDHVRFHGFFLDCFAMEAKHRYYKYQIQNRLDSEMKNKSVYAEKVLQRLLDHASGAYKKTLLPGELFPPTKLISFFGAEVASGKGLQLNHGTIMVDDFIFTRLGTGVVLHCLSSSSADGTTVVRVVIESYNLVP